MPRKDERSVVFAFCVGTRPISSNRPRRWGVKCVAHDGFRFPAGRARVLVGKYHCLVVLALSVGTLPVSVSRPGHVRVFSLALALALWLVLGIHWNHHSLLVSCSRIW